MDTARDQHWQIWVDTGGTFTDYVAVSPEGVAGRAKVLSTSALRGVVVETLDPTHLRVRERWSAPPDFIRDFAFQRLGATHPDTQVAHHDPASGLLELTNPLPPGTPSETAFEVRSWEEAPVLAARLVTQTPHETPLPPLSMRLATTRGTNALLTRGGAATALFVTQGFGDLLVIGTQQRPDLFALDIRRPAPLYQALVEVTARVAAEGHVLLPLDEEQLTAEATRLLSLGITSAAVALLHSDRFPEQERALAVLLRRAGFAHVCCSSDLAPFIKILPRAQTALVNAYLAPIVQTHLERVDQALPPGRSTLQVMTSAGGLVPAKAFRAKDSLLSGPAGGIVGAARAGRRAGCAKIIALDMGGTSTDVARYDGDFEYVFEHTIGDAHLVAPALAIASVAAGGGSVCVADAQGLRVGPVSAGASPGPDRFGIPLVPGHARAATDALVAASEERDGAPVAREELLEGFLDIANQRDDQCQRQLADHGHQHPFESLDPSALRRWDWDRLTFLH